MVSGSFNLYLQDPSPDDGVNLKYEISSSEISERFIIFLSNIPSIPFNPPYTLSNAFIFLLPFNNPTTLELITAVGPPD